MEGCGLCGEPANIPIVDVAVLTLGYVPRRDGLGHTDAYPLTSLVTGCLHYQCLSCRDAGELGCRLIGPTLCRVRYQYTAIGIRY